MVKGKRRKTTCRRKGRKRVDGLTCAGCGDMMIGTTRHNLLDQSGKQAKVETDARARVNCDVLYFRDGKNWSVWWK